MACFQLIQFDPAIGALVRVFPEIREESVLTSELMNSTAQFFTYVALSAMQRAGLVVRLGAAPAPAAPAMRTPGGVSPDGKPLNWWIFAPDGARHRVDTLSAEEERLSIREVITADTLYDRVVTAWTPVSAEERRAHAAARLSRQPTQAPASRIHFIYFENRDRADAAAAEFSRRAYGVSVTRSTDQPSGWLLKVETSADTDASGQIEELTVTLNGEYDGWETRIANGSASSNED